MFKKDSYNIIAIFLPLPMETQWGGERLNPSSRCRVRISIRGSGL